MKKTRRRYITLIEVLLSFSLIIIIVGSLLMYLRRTIFLQTKLQTAEREILSRAHIQQQLHYVFSHLEYGKDAEFFTREGTQGLELHFSFDNKIDIDHSFSGKVKGVIRVQDRQLIIEIKPILSDTLIREWVIAKNIDALAWRFISFDTTLNAIPLRLWPQCENSYPDIFSLVIEIRGITHIFPIFLFKNFSGIPYERKKGIV